MKTNSWTTAGQAKDISSSPNPLVKSLRRGRHWVWGPNRRRAIKEWSIAINNETWLHMFEPQRRADNKQWKRKDQTRPCIAKRTISSKKMLYAIYFNSSGPVAQVPCPSGHTVTGRFYKSSVLKKVKEFCNKKWPSKGWSGVHLLHDNASSHKCKVV